MEGTQGITIETAVPSMQSAPKTSEHATTTMESTNVESEPKETTESDTAKSAEQTESRSENEPKTDAETVEETQNQVMEGFEKLTKSMTDEEKEKFMKDYFLALLADDRKKEQESKLVDTFAELIRLLKLIIALIKLQILYPDKVNFSGKDLGLSETPPEGEDQNLLAKAINGKDSKESWKNFRDEVDGIENVSFSELMNRVLAANERHSIKKLKQIKKDMTLPKNLVDEGRHLLEKSNPTKTAAPARKVVK